MSDLKEIEAAAIRLYDVLLGSKRGTEEGTLLEIITRHLSLVRDKRVEELEAALTESVKLQSHYAALLNDYDGGQRMQFASPEAWLARLSALRSPEAKT